jgi:hypothetical protein
MFYAHKFIKAPPIHPRPYRTSQTKQQIKMQASQTTTMQENKFIVPTKTDSRTSETQKRMYGRPDGLVYRFITKDAVTVSLEEWQEYNQLDLSGKASPTSVVALHRGETDYENLVFNSSHPRAA